MHNRDVGRSGLVTAVLLPMGLICVFAFCSLLLVIVGVDVYRQVQASGEKNYESAVVASYLRTKIAHNNREGAIYLREENGLELLVIESAAQGEIYETLVFYQDGQLLEGLKNARDAFDPALAFVIAPVESCEFAIEGGLFTAELVTAQGELAQVAMALAGGGARNA